MSISRSGVAFLWDGIGTPWGFGDLGIWGLARQSGLEGFPHRAIAEGGDLGPWGLGDLGTW